MPFLDDDNEEGIVGRKLVFCSKLQSFDTADLIRTCEECKGFFVYCCHCNNTHKNGGRYKNGRVCHHFRLIFTDGACLNNGQVGATAGAGIACGAEETWQLSLPIGNLLDPDQRRTSQRAELLAALTGLRYMQYKSYLEGANEDQEKCTKEKRKGSGAAPEDSVWVIATDSEYLVKGMTEWLPAWKVCY